jgi:hypothetical protein
LLSNFLSSVDTGIVTSLLVSISFNSKVSNLRLFFEPFGRPGLRLTQDEDDEEDEDDDDDEEDREEDKEDEDDDEETCNFFILFSFFGEAEQKDEEEEDDDEDEDGDEDDKEEDDETSRLVFFNAGLSGTGKVLFPSLLSCPDIKLAN